MGLQEEKKALRVFLPEWCQNFCECVCVFFSFVDHSSTPPLYLTSLCALLENVSDS